MKLGNTSRRDSWLMDHDTGKYRDFVGIYHNGRKEWFLLKT